MNLATIRSRVCRAVGMSTSDADDLALIDGWANDAVVHFLRKVKVNVKTAALTLTAGEGDYTLDTDILSFTDVWYGASSGNRMLVPVDSAELSRMRRLQSSVEATTKYVAMQGGHLLMLHPAPETSDDKLHMLYTPRPAAMSATSDSPSDSGKGNIPPEYHSTIEAYVKWKAAEAHDHKPSQYGLTFQAEWERGLADARADMNRKSGVIRPRKIGGGRRRIYPTTPGTDLR